MDLYNIKTNRIFTPLRKYAWLFLVIVAFGGLWLPKLGLLMIPIMLTLMFLGLFKGKYWCGNICPHGSLFDGIIMPVSINKKLPGLFRSKITMTLMFIWFMYMMGSRLSRVIALWGTTPFIDKLGYVFVMNYLIVTILGSILALIISPRAWCSICPMGTMQILFYKLGKKLGINRKTDKKITIADQNMCHICGKCSRVCPMQLTPYLHFSDNGQFEHEQCIRCRTCEVNCPAGILSLGTTTNVVDMVHDNKHYEVEQKPQKIVARVKEIIEIKDDVREYRFTLIEPAKIEFKAGQFILLKVQEEPEMYRAYSIFSYNDLGNEVSITIKRIPDGYGTTRIFNNINEGDIVELKGPMGHELVIKNHNAEKLLFVAGGIGITPFLQMTKEAIKSNNKVKLIYGVNKSNELLYIKEFEKLAGKNSGFEFIPVVAADNKLTEHQGLVTDVMKELDLSEYKVYMCGPQPMINACINLLQSAGADDENIYYESA